MTAHIKKEPTELEFVLSQIKQLKDEETSLLPEFHPPHLNPETGKKYDH